MTIGVGITTHNRRDTATATIDTIRALAPGPVVVVDDGSTDPYPGADWRNPFPLGVAAAKNRCLQLLDGCEHIFLFDDDTYPIAENWWRPYVDSPEPHLMHNFESGPAHWRIRRAGGDLRHAAYDKPRGCLLYLHADVLRFVGGMHVAFGRHGGEHQNFSDRIFEAGLTRWRYASPKLRTVECLDQTSGGISSVGAAHNRQWRNVTRPLPGYAEYRDQPVPVLVPRRPDHGYRDTIYGFLLQRYWAATGYRVVEGPHYEGPFNRSAATNLAAGLAGNWAVAVIADADTWVPTEQLDRAIALAQQTGKLVAAFSTVNEISQADTEQIMATRRLATPTGTIRSGEMLTQSSMLAVPRNLWEHVHGFDEGFRGWGGEDNAFWRACTLAAGEPLRIDGHAHHLWHPPSGDRAQRRKDPLYQANWARWQRYAEATTIDQVLALR